MRVLCIDDKNQPEGASVESGKEYMVEKDFVNNWGQRVFIISGIRNEGRTRNGLLWNGYLSSRFVIMDKSPVKEQVLEEDLALLN